MIDLVATLHLKFTCHAQSENQITSIGDILDPFTVFPAGLTELRLVSFHVFIQCFLVCVCDVRGACCADVA